MKIKKVLLFIMILFAFSFAGCFDEEEPDKKYYEISFIVEGEEIDEYKILEGAKIKAPESPYKYGYDFIGWYNGENKFDFNNTVKEKMKLIAKFEPIRYELNLFLGGGTIDDNFPVSSRYTIEDTITLPTPTKENYTFVGWQELGSNSVEATVEFSNRTGNRNYEAVWTNEDVALLYVDNELYSSKRVILGANVLASVDNLDETTAGWFKDEKLTQIFTSNDVITKGMRLYTKRFELYNVSVQNVLKMNNGSLTVSYVEGHKWNGVIPREIGGQLVKNITSISKFYSELDIVLPSSVTSIEANAFDKDHSIYNLPISITKMGGIDVKIKDSSTIIVANTVTKLNKGAFVGVQNIEFEANSKIETLEEEIFVGTSIKTIKIPSSVMAIETKAFYGVETLTNVEFETNSKVEVINERAFLGTNITSIKIPSSVKTIAEHAFGEYSSESPLVEVVFEEDSQLETIEDHAFTYTSLTTITIPSSVKTIGKYSFAYVDTLTSVEFEEDSQLETIGEWAFNRAKIETITIPTSVKVIEKHAFEEVDTLTSVEFEADSQLEEIGEFAFADTKLTTITIPASVRVIGRGAFSNEGLLTSMIFEKGSKLEEIHSGIFGGTGVTSITIPASIKIIEDYAFYDMQRLINVEFEENSQLEEIGENAFAYTNLETITIPASLKVIGENAFLASGLKSVDFESGSQLEIIGKRALGIYLEQINLPNSVTSISGVKVRVENGDEIIILKENKEIPFLAFQMLPITKITFEEDSQLETIEDHAFTYTSLTTITIPSSVKTIEEYAFAYINTLTSVEFEENSQLETIGENAFIFTNLETITIPSSVKTIGRSSFAAVYTLTSVEFEEDSQLEEIGERAFSETKLTTITIPASVKTIGEDVFHRVNGVVVVIKYQNIYSLIEENILDVNEIHVLKTLTGTNSYLEDNYNKTESGDYWVYTKKAN